MAWFTAIPAMLVALVVLFLPGLVAGIILRGRGLLLFVLAPVISLAALCLLSFVLPIFGLYWRPLLVFPLMLLLAAGISILCRALKFSLAEQRAEQIGLSRYLLPVALAIPALFVSVLFITGVQEPERFTTVFDNVFHLNGVRYVTDTLNYSPTKFGRMTSYDDRYYQDAWHLFVSLVHQISGASILVSVNAVTLATTLTVWPVVMVYFVRSVAGKKLVPTLAGGVVAAALPSMPLGLVIYGPLYPNQFAYLFVPVALAFILQAAGMTQDASLGDKKSVYFLAALTFSLVSVMHANGFMALLFFVVAVVIGKLSYCFMKQSVLQRCVTVGFGLAAIAVIVISYPKLASVTNRDVERTVPVAVSDFFNLSFFSDGKEWILMLLAVVALSVGIVLKKQAVVPLALFVAFFGFLLISTISTSNPVTHYLGSVWHGDSPRFSALISVAIAPLSVIGFEFILEEVQARFKRPIVSVIASGIVLLLVVTGINFGASKSMADRFALPTDDTRLSSVNKQKIINSLPKHVPAGQRVLADPATGGAFSYLFQGYPAVMMHMNGDLTPDEQMLWDHFAEAATNPAVCPAVKRLNIYYAIYFPGQRRNGIQYRPKGMDNIAKAPGIEVVEQAGNDALYRVTVCDK